MDASNRAGKTSRQDILNNICAAWLKYKYIDYYQKKRIYLYLKLVF